MYKTVVGLSGRAVKSVWRGYGPDALIKRAANRMICHEIAFAGPNFLPSGLKIRQVDPKAKLLLMENNGADEPAPLMPSATGSQPVALKPVVADKRGVRLKALFGGLVPAAAGAVVALMNIKNTIAFQLCLPYLRSLRSSTIEALSVASNTVAGFLVGFLATYAYLTATPPQAEKPVIEKADKKNLDVFSQRLADNQTGEINFPGLELGGLTLMGTGQINNEDWLFMAQAGQKTLLVIGDGQHGTQASALALEVLGTEIRDPDFSLPQSAVRIDSVIKEQKRPGLIDKETRTGTLAALIEPARDEARLLNVGNSRAYLFREGKIIILTRDDSLAAAEYITAKHPNAAFPLEQNVSEYYEALRTLSDHQNILTSVLGEERVGIDENALPATDVKLRAGDLLIMASNGLHGFLPFAALEEIVAANKDEAPLALARALKEAAGDYEHCDLTLAVYRHETAKVS
jgi:serine/threonine protein phosphatase PrpC